MKKSFTISHANSAISTDELDRFENETGVVIPDEYKRFLLENNGGSPNPAGVHYTDHYGVVLETQVEQFLGITDHSSTSLKRVIDMFYDRIPEELFPIAFDPYYNLVCIAQSGTNAGKIYLWKRGEEADEPSYHNMYLVAENFREFLVGFYSPKEQ